jgi:hypothetical protein
MHENPKEIKHQEVLSVLQARLWIGSCPSLETMAR